MTGATPIGKSQGSTDEMRGTFFFESVYRKCVDNSPLQETDNHFTEKEEEEGNQNITELITVLVPNNSICQKLRIHKDDKQWSDLIEGDEFTQELFACLGFYRPLPAATLSENYHSKSLGHTRRAYYLTYLQFECLLICVSPVHAYLILPTTNQVATEYLEAGPKPC
ncbi:hypothetical protein ACTXT7_010954 [Hymenolepis weldensis]